MPRQIWLATVFAVVWYVPAGAQAPPNLDPMIECRPPLDTKTCKGAVQPGKHGIPINVTVVDGSDASQGIGGQKLTFHPSKCCVFPPQDVSDTNGEAESRWSGTLGAKDSVIVQIWLEVDGLIVTKEAVIYGSTVAPPGSAATLKAIEGQGRVWAPGEYLRGFLRVQVENVSKDRCSLIKVAYRPLTGGSVTLDTAQAEWEDEKCQAATRWKLSNALGTQQLRAQIVGSRATEDFYVLVRQGPRIAVGVMYPFFKVTADTLRVDAQTGDSTLVPIEDPNEITPMFGVEFPPLLPIWGIDRLPVRFFVGVSFEQPTREFFVGALPAPLFGYEYAGGLAQLSLGVRLIRLEEFVADAEQCKQQRAVGRFCLKENLKVNAYIGVTVDGSTLLSKAITALAGT